MASEVLSGTSNPRYTNNTGQNVRIVINYVEDAESISWAGVSITRGVYDFFPTEFVLAPNQSFSAICGAYNIVAIKEDGS